MTATVETTSTTNTAVSVTIGRDELARALTVTKYAMARRPALPIMSGARIGAGMVQAFDFESRIDVNIPALAGMPAVVVSHALLSDVVKKISRKTDVTLTVDGSRLTVAALSGLSVDVPTMPAEDWPMPFAHAVIETVFAPEVFARLCAPIVAAGRDDTLPTLTGVRFEATAGTVTTVATDRYRLAYVNAAAPGLSDSAVLVPWRPLDHVRKNAKGLPVGYGWRPDTSVGAYFEGRPNVVTFAFGPVTVSTRTLDGEFPKWRTLVPDLGACELFGVADRSGLSAAVDAVAVTCERNTPVRIDPGAGVLSVQSGTVEESRATMTVPYSGDLGGMFAVNPAYMADGLAFVQGSDVIIHGKAPARPYVFTGSDDADSGYLLMPVRLTGSH